MSSHTQFFFGRLIRNHGYVESHWIGWYGFRVDSRRVLKLSATRHFAWHWARHCTGERSFLFLRSQKKIPIQWWSTAELGSETCSKILVFLGQSPTCYFFAVRVRLQSVSGHVFAKKISLEFREWRSRAHRVLRLNINIWLPLFWSTWSRARGQDSATCAHNAGLARSRHGLWL